MIYGNQTIEPRCYYEGSEWLSNELRKECHASGPIVAIRRMLMLVEEACDEDVGEIAVGILRRFAGKLIEVAQVIESDHADNADSGFIAYDLWRGVDVLEAAAFVAKMLEDTEAIARVVRMCMDDVWLSLLVMRRAGIYR